MDSTLLAALVGLVAGSIGIVGTVMVGRRTRSGRIDTTDAAELWTEGRAMRQELRNELSAALLELKEANAEIKLLRSNLAEASNDLMKANSELDDLRGHIALMEEDVDALRTQVAVLKEKK